MAGCSRRGKKPYPCGEPMALQKFLWKTATAVSAAALNAADRLLVGRGWGATPAVIESHY
jgi:hypothetical protein